MSDEEQESLKWEELPLDVRRALLRSARSQIWWKQLGDKIRGFTPISASILSFLALWQLFGGVIKSWLNQ